MKYNEYKMSAHNAVKEHFENDNANNFSDVFLKKCWFNHEKIFEILEGETLILETNVQRSLDDVEYNLKNYLNSKTNDHELMILINEEIKSLINNYDMLVTRNILDNNLRFNEAYDGMRKGQKFSKYLAKKYSEKNELHILFSDSNSKINEIIGTSNNTLYLRLSCSMKDYLNLGFQNESSCTRIYSDSAAYPSYAKAVFTYAQNSTIIATMYAEKEDAVSRNSNALVRQVLYLKEDSMLGFRKYGHSDEYKSIFSKEMLKFFEEKDLFNDYKYLTNLRNRKIVNYRNLKNQLFDHTQRASYYSDRIGYIDTIHYTEAKGDALFYKIDFEELEFQQSIFDTDYDFENDPQNRLVKTKEELNHKLTNFYKSMNIEFDVSQLVVPYEGDVDYSDFYVDDYFYEQVHEVITTEINKTTIEEL